MHQRKIAKEWKLLDIDLIMEIESNDDKSEAEWTLLNYYKTLAIISEILVSESKLNISSEEAVSKIRNCMSDNL